MLRPYHRRPRRDRRDEEQDPGFHTVILTHRPRGEVKVVTAPPPRFTPHGVLPRPRSSRAGSDGKPPSWSERLEALKYVPPLLKLVYETHRGYTIAILALRTVRSF